MSHGLRKNALQKNQEKIINNFLLLFREGELMGKQEQTKFYDLQRGITEDFQRLAKFQRTFIKKRPKRFTDFKRFVFLTFFVL